MESKANYTIVGMAVVILTFGLIAIALWLSVGFDQKNYKFYTVNMQESVVGLTDESIVRYNGVKVGAIAKITLDKQNPQQVKLLLKIEEGTPIFASTHASLVNQGITGSAFLGLSADSASHDLIATLPGELYPIIPYQPSFLNQLQKTILTLSQNLKLFLSDENAANLKSSLNNLSKLTAVFGDNQEAIRVTLEQMPKLTKNLEAGVESFDKMSRQLALTGQEFTRTLQSAQHALPQALSLMQHIDGITEDVEALSNKMSRDPSVVIWGNPPDRKGPGE